MAESKKTDNHNLPAKLALRRYFLKKYHPAGARVLDCCQGAGVIWSELRKEFELESYWGLDVKPKSGRLRIDSVRVLSQPGWSYNVIDVDTYGLPWKHWEAILRNAPLPCTVFLTVGSVRTGGGSVITREEMSSLGLGFRRLKLPQSFTVKLLRKLSLSYCLTRCYDYSKIPSEAIEAVSDGNARYLGVHLKSEQPGANQAALHAQAVRELETCPTSIASAESIVQEHSPKSADSPMP